MAENQNLKQPAVPDLTALLAEQKRDVMMSMNCVQIGVVQSFDAATQRASVQIAMKQVAFVAEDGTRTLQDYPVLLECPVFIYSGAADFISMPISTGDGCLVLFNDRDIDQWNIAGPGNAPTTVRIHDISDGFCLVGIRPLTEALIGIITNGIRISHGGGNTKIDLIQDLIESTGDLFRHNGDMEITGNLTILGDTYGNGSNDIILKANLRQQSPYVLEAGNGATGNFSTVQVVKGIVVSGT